MFVQAKNSEEKYNQRTLYNISGRVFVKFSHGISLISQILVDTKLLCFAALYFEYYFVAL